METIVFYEAVRNMRSLQIEYFKEHDRLILQRCKAAERAVDKFIAELEERETTRVSPTGYPTGYPKLF